MTTSSAREMPLGFLLSDAQRLIRNQFDTAAEAAGLSLTAGEARTLGHIAKLEGRRQSVLAEYMNIDPMTLVSYLDRLEAAGLVERQPDPADRRAKIVRLTPKSEPVVRKIREVGRQVRDQATEGLDDDDVARFVAYLTRMIENLGGDSSKAVDCKPARTAATQRS